VIESHAERLQKDAGPTRSQAEHLRRTLDFGDERI
jgi:hypothetical protein